MENLKVEWVTISGERCLKFTFYQQLTAEAAKAAIDKWAENFKSNSDKKIKLIWDCLEMKGYEPEARNMWQRALKELKPQIDNIWVITNSSLIKMGTMAMGMFASYKMKVVESFDEIEF